MAAPTETWIYKPRSWFEPLGWSEVFGDAPTKIHVDLGAGDGGFIRDRALKNPDTSFLAVERLLGRARKISRRAARAGLTNVRILRIEAAYAVECLFPASSVHSMTILFPDPWPKRKHWKNRLIQSAFLDLCAGCLAPGGWIAMKTDHAAYAEHMIEALAGSTRLKRWEGPEAEGLLSESTDFEEEFRKEGRAFHLLVARRAEG